MRLDELIPKLQHLLAIKLEQRPDVLVIHVVGNNLGYKKLHKLRRRIKSTLKKVRNMLPNTRIVWSQILPRQIWRASKNTAALNRAADRINNFAGWLCVKSGGGFVKYPEIGWNEPGLFKKDGVHLSDLGNNLFLYRLQYFLQEFL